MARSVIGALVSGTRGMLSAQLFVSIVGIALAGWTLTITNEVIRERDRLRERVVQLESSMAERGVVVPPTPAVVNTPVAPSSVYPSAVGDALNAPAADSTVPITTAPPNAAPAPAASARDLGEVITDLFAPPPPMRVIVLHVRDQADAAAAQRIGEELSRDSDLSAVVVVMAPRDPRHSGYAYFDGRQNRATAELVAQFHDVARRAGIAPWSAQLRGVALPSQGEYTADRLDIVLPPLPQAEPPAPAAASPQR